MGETKNLHSEEAIKKIKEMVNNITICMFCTKVEKLPLKTRPMTTLDVDIDGNLWFMSSRVSDKNNEINMDNEVQLIYENGGDSHFMSIYGKAQIVKGDRKKIEDLWNVFAKAWFRGGKDDPNISLIKVIPEESYYWDTENGKMISLLKIAASAVSGKTMDDGVKGKMTL